MSFDERWSAPRFDHLQARYAVQSGALEDALESYVHPHVLVIDELGYRGNVQAAAA